MFQEGTGCSEAAILSCPRDKRDHLMKIRHFAIHLLPPNPRKAQAADYFCRREQTWLSVPSEAVGILVRASRYVTFESLRTLIIRGCVILPF